MNQYIFRVEQATHMSIMAESEQEAWQSMGEADLTDIFLFPEHMDWDLVEVNEGVEED